MLLAFSCLLPILLAVLCLVAGSIAVTLIRNPDLHVWPSIHRCQLCKKRVYVWQKHEHREYEVTIDNPDNLPEERLARITASGIVHCRCRGTPKVTFTAHAAPGRRPPSGPVLVRPPDERSDN